MATATFEMPYDASIEDLKANTGIVENGNTATNNIDAGKYVNWNGKLYTADSAISIGDTLADSGEGKNLTVCPDGGFNALNSNITSLINTVTPIAITPTTPSGVTLNSHACYRIGKIVVINVALTVTTATAVGDTGTIFTIPNCPPSTSTPVIAIGNLGAGGRQTSLISNAQDGIVRNDYDGFNVANKKYYFNFCYTMG